MSRLSCPELVAFLDDYVAGTLPADVATGFERHLAGCSACVAYANTYRETVRLGREAYCASAELPPEVPEELVEAILGARASPRAD